MEKKEEKKELSGLDPIPCNKNTLEKRRVMFRRNNGRLLSFSKDTEITSKVDRALWAQLVPADIRMGGISTKMRGSITVLTRMNASADMRIGLREIIVTDTKMVDPGCIDIERNETWE
jgi:hypothetical protein